MNQSLDQYLSQVYRRDIMGESVAVEVPKADPKLLGQIEAEIARIDALKLGAHLVSRDFVSYQNRRALVALREKLRQGQAHGPA